MPPSRPPSAPGLSRMWRTSSWASRSPLRVAIWMTLAVSLLPCAWSVRAGPSWRKRADFGPSKYAFSAVARWVPSTKTTSLVNSMRVGSPVAGSTRAMKLWQVRVLAEPLAGGSGSATNDESFWPRSSDSFPRSSNAKARKRAFRTRFSGGSPLPGRMVRTASGPAVASCSVRSGRNHRSSFLPARWRGPRPALEGASPCTEGAAPHPQVHVVHRLRPVHRLGVVGDVHQEPARGQAVAALHDLDVVDEPQQAFLALEDGAGALDVHGLVVGVLELQDDVRQHLEAPLRRVVDARPSPSPRGPCAGTARGPRSARGSCPRGRPGTRCRARSRPPSPRARCRGRPPSAGSGCRSTRRR